MTSDMSAPFGKFKRPFPMPESRAGMSGFAAAMTATVDMLDLPLVRAGWREHHARCLLAAYSAAERAVRGSMTSHELWLSSPRERWRARHRLARLGKRADRWQMTYQRDWAAYRASAQAQALLAAEAPKGGRGSALRNEGEYQDWCRPISYASRPEPRGILREVQDLALARLERQPHHPQITEARNRGIMMPSLDYRRGEIARRKANIENPAFGDAEGDAIYQIRREGLATGGAR